MCYIFFFQAEDGIRDLVRSRGLGDVYKRQNKNRTKEILYSNGIKTPRAITLTQKSKFTKKDINLNYPPVSYTHLTLPTSDLV